MRHAQQPEAAMLPTPQPGADELPPSQPAAASYPKCEAAELSSSQPGDTYILLMPNYPLLALSHTIPVMSLRVQHARPRGPPSLPP